MVLIPKQNKIQEALTRGEIDQEIREYLGMSMIGHPCLRFLQYYLKMSYKTSISKRIKRLFNVGHDSEPIIIKSLEEIGAIITDTQLELIGFAGHWKGHIDGNVINLPACEKTLHLLEMKTHNDKSFKDLIRNKVRVSKPMHYAQVQRYMGGQGLKRALYVAMNKNDSTYYTERIYFDQEYYDGLLCKEQAIIFAEELLPRIGTGKITWHECRFCDAKDVCFGLKEPEKNCRTCKFVEMHNKGVWLCARKFGEPRGFLFTSYIKHMTFIQQKKACDKYELEDMLK